VAYGFGSWFYIWHDAYSCVYKWKHE
jgi:hypothetical protein